MTGGDQSNPALIAKDNPNLILVVEDDPIDGPYIREVLDSAGFEALLVESAEQALDVLESRDTPEPDMILLDIDLPGMDGLALVHLIKSHAEYQYIPVVMCSGHDELAFKIDGLNRGADDYITKPYQDDELLARVNSMLRTRRLYQNLRFERQINKKLTKTVRSERILDLLGRSPHMRKIRELALDISNTDSHVLVLGESGTGKEVVARAIHAESNRGEGPFVVVNCAAYAETLLHSELFGHEKGSFTGAIRKKPGRFEQAGGGTIFLDEIGEISLPIQVTLLRVIQEKTFERVGGEETLTSNARIIAATNRDLKKAMAQGSFREDLYWRLNVISILVPPLRERKEDIPQLISNFIARFNEQFRKNVKSFSREAMDIVFAHHWPGNVRELENVVERAMVLTKGDTVKPEDLPGELYIGGTRIVADPETNLEQIERDHVRAVLEKCQWNKYKAAKVMGISRSTLYSKIKKHGLDHPRSYEN